MSVAQTVAVNAMRRSALVMREMLQMLRESAGHTTLADPDAAGTLVDRVIAVATACDPLVASLNDAADQIEVAPVVAPTVDSRLHALALSAGWEIEQMVDAAFRVHAAANTATSSDLALRGMLTRIGDLSRAICTAIDATSKLDKDDADDLRRLVYGSAAPLKTEGGEA